MIKKILSCFGLIAVLTLIVVITILWQASRFWLQSPPEDVESQEVVIEEGEGLSSIAADLKEQGLIASEFWFKVFAKLSGTARDIQAGSFSVAAGENYSALVDILIDAVSKDSQITIPEGYTLEQIGEVVTSNFNISKEDWDTATGPDSPFLESHELLQISDIPEGHDLEGYLFPDTYRFYEEATAEDIVQKMLDEMLENIQAVYPEINIHPGGPETLHDYLTLASILEREVRGYDDMVIVSGIFHNRLEVGMALQADSTVNYVTGKKTPGVALNDTKIDSPYNTYRYNGLPPGPISSPGFEALKAAANPANTDYLYFLTDDQGDVYYAETFNQHVANKNQHLR